MVRQDIRCKAEVLVPKLSVLVERCRNAATSMREIYDSKTETLALSVKRSGNIRILKYFFSN